jgi:hypothetical protein
MKMSCLANVKRVESHKRPQVPPHTVFATYIGDCSGSMSNQHNASANGVYEWVKSMSSGINNNGQNGYLTVTFFDTKIYKRLENVSSKNIRISINDARDWAEPRGMTRLYDTAIEGVNTLRRRIKNYKKDNPLSTVHGIFQLFSDGYDNNSMASIQNMNDAIKGARGDGITCYYLGIGQNAIEVGNQYGFSEEESLTVDIGEDTSQYAFRSCSLNALRSASTGVSESFQQNVRFMSAPTQNPTPCTKSYVPNL